MKKIIVALTLLFSFNLHGQKEIVLRISHALNGNAFAYNQNFTINGVTNYLQGYNITYLELVYIMMEVK